MKRLAFFAALAVVALATAGSPVQAQFIESFETPIAVNPNAPPGTPIVLPSGTWHAFNNSAPIGGTGVFTQGGAGAPFPADPSAGTLYGAMNFNNGSGLAQISTYMMSPVLTFNNGDQISFISRTVTAPAFPDRLRLVLSTNGASTTPADFSTILLTINDTLTTTGYPSVWTNFSATLAGLPGGGVSGRFAFHYDVPGGGPSGANSDFIGFDLAQYTSVPEPTSMALLGIPAIAGLVIRRRRAKASA